MKPMNFEQGLQQLPSHNVPCNHITEQPLEWLNDNDWLKDLEFDDLIVNPNIDNAYSNDFSVLSDDEVTNGNFNIDVPLLSEAYLNEMADILDVPMGNINGLDHSYKSSTGSQEIPSLKVLGHCTTESQEISSFNVLSPMMEPLPSTFTMDFSSQQIKEITDMDWLKDNLNEMAEILEYVPVGNINGLDHSYMSSTLSQEVPSLNVLGHCTTESQEISSFNVLSPMMEPLPSTFTPDFTSEQIKEMHAPKQKRRMGQSSSYSDIKKRKVESSSYSDITKVEMQLNPMEKSSKIMSNLQPSRESVLGLRPKRPRRRDNHGHMDAHEIDKEIYKEEGFMFLLKKKLKQSDVGPLKRIVIPTKEAEFHLPALTDQDPEIMSMSMVDMDNLRTWTFKYRFWKNKNGKGRMYVLKETGEFIKLHALVLGDFIMVYKHILTGKYVSGIQWDKLGLRIVIKAKKLSHNENVFENSSDINVFNAMLGCKEQSTHDKDCNNGSRESRSLFSSIDDVAFNEASSNASFLTLLPQLSLYVALLLL